MQTRSLALSVLLVWLAVLPPTAAAGDGFDPARAARARWTPAFAARPPPPAALAPRSVNAVKAGVASAATLLLLLDLWLARRGRARWMRRGRDAALAALGLAGLLCWSNLLQLNFPGFAHHSDTFHSYLGAKYFPELGYTRLYACTAVADWEAGLRGAAVERPMRDLTTNRLETTAAILADPARCTAHFSPERWAAFAADVRWLREQVGPRRWNRFQQDHGYNATPLWTLLVSRAVGRKPASAGRIAQLRLLDPAALLLMWGAAMWAFGWRISCVAAIYWGTNYTAPFGWTGGAILRQDWLAAVVIGICLLRRERPAAAGALFAVATLLRIFPALVIGGVALGAAGEMLKHRRLRLAATQRRFAAGTGVAFALLVPLSALTGGGFESWIDFARNSRLYLDTPLANHVGLKTLLAHDHAQRSEVARDASLADPMEPWKQARRDRFARLELLFWGLVIGFAALVGRAAASHPAWVGAVLGVALIPVATELTGYYWSVLLALAFAMAVRPAIGAALCGLAALGWWVGDHWHWTDQIHVWISALTVVFCAFAVLLLAARPSAPPVGA